MAPLLPLFHLFRLYQLLELQHSPLGKIRTAAPQGMIDRVSGGGTIRRIAMRVT